MKGCMVMDLRHVSEMVVIKVKVEVILKTFWRANNMQIKIFQSWRELVNSTAHATVCSAGRKKCAFLGGSWASCQRDFIISGKSI